MFYQAQIEVIYADCAEVTFAENCEISHGIVCEQHTEN